MVTPDVFGRVYRSSILKYFDRNSNLYKLRRLRRSECRPRFYSSNVTVSQTDVTRYISKFNKLYIR